jgi:3-isopropylmalate dehydratase small subunit
MLLRRIVISKQLCHIYFKNVIMNQILPLAIPKRYENYLNI